jgi:hypothetical protein
MVFKDQYCVLWSTSIISVSVYDSPIDNNVGVIVLSIIICKWIIIVLQLSDWIIYHRNYSYRFCIFIITHHTD